jgi:hypothetical protein
VGPFQLVLSSEFGSPASKIIGNFLTNAEAESATLFHILQAFSDGCLQSQNFFLVMQFLLLYQSEPFPKYFAGILVAACFDKRAYQLLLVIGQDNVSRCHVVILTGVIGIYCHLTECMPMIYYLESFEACFYKAPDAACLLHRYAESLSALAPGCLSGELRK